MEILVGGDGVVKIVGVDCRPLCDEQRLSTISPQLNSDRQSRIQRLQSPLKKAQCAAAGWLLTQLFGQDGVPPVLTHGNRGKPYLTAGAPYFSLSHTDSYVFCGVADSELGLDAQVIGPCRQNVAQRCFTESELRWMAEAPDQRFTWLWVLKEAYVKYTGFGLVLPLSSFSVPLPPAGWNEETHCAWWELAHDDVWLGVCCGDNSPVKPIQWLTIDTPN